MKIADILDAKGRTVHWILPWKSAADAVARLEQLGVGALVVCDGEQRMVGIVSERDLIRGLAHRGANLLDVRVEEIMTHTVGTARLDEPIASAMARMTRDRFRHLPVLERGQLVGMVSIGDLVKARLRELELETGVLRDVYIAAH